MSFPATPALSEDDSGLIAYRREPDGTPVTQILYIDVNPAHNLEDADTSAGKVWVELLDLIQDAPGFRRLYWGQRLEEPEKVQIHVSKCVGHACPYPDVFCRITEHPLFCVHLGELLE